MRIAIFSEGAGADVEADFWMEKSLFFSCNISLFISKDDGDDYSLASGLTCWLVTQMARRRVGGKWGKGGERKRFSTG